MTLIALGDFIMQRKIYKKNSLEKYNRGTKHILLPHLSTAIL